MEVNDCISRAEVLKLMQDNWHTHNGDWAMQESMDDIRALPSVTPQEPQTFKWCDTCKEYDQEKHCCHRYSKVIRDAVAEIRQEPILNKIREQMKDYLRGVEITLDVLVANDPLRPKMEGAKDTLEECLELIDKAENEPQESEE